METKILAVALVACAMGFANGNEYPAGVDPRSCPNYPNCDNAALHGAPAATGNGNPWNSVAPVPTAANTWDSWESTSHWKAPAAPAVSVAAQYPAGVDPQICPNYPNCDNVASHGGAFTPHATPGAWRSLGSAPAAVWNSAPNGHPPVPVAPQYPPGVSAQSCPNYPYC